MIAKETLTRLNAWKGEGRFVTSVYLDVNPVTCPKGEYFAMFRNLVRDEVGRIAGGQKLLSEDLRKIENSPRGKSRNMRNSRIRKFPGSTKEGAGTAGMKTGSEDVSTSKFPSI
jgi:hypothetical protein